MRILGEKSLKNRLTFDIYILRGYLFFTLNTMAQNENKTVQSLWSNEGIKKTLLEMTDGIFQDYLSSLAKEKGQYEEIWKILVVLTREEDKRDRYQERLFSLQELKEKNEKQREEEHWRKSNLQKYLQQEIGKIDKSRLKLEEDYMNSFVNFSQQYRKIHKIIQTIDLKIDQLEAKRASLLDQWDRAHQDDSKILASELSDIEQDILSYRYDQDQFRSKLEDFEYNLNMIEWLIKEKEDEMLMLQSDSDQLWELDYFLMLLHHGKYHSNVNVKNHSNLESHLSHWDYSKSWDFSQNVFVSTNKSSKGLEADCVILYITPRDEERIQDGEEWWPTTNLYYVLATRARKKLYMLFTSGEN